MMSVDEFWEFLEGLHQTREFEKIASLPAAASSDNLQQAEGQLGVLFPEDFRRFLHRHDGSGGFYISNYESVAGLGDLRFLSVNDLLSTWQMMVRFGVDAAGMDIAGEQHGPVKPYFWNPRWIPFEESGCGDCTFLDLDPAEGGTLGQIVSWWHEGGVSTVLFSSLPEFLTDVADKIRIGNCEFDYIPSMLR